MLQKSPGSSRAPECTVTLNHRLAELGTKVAVDISGGSLAVPESSWQLLQAPTFLGISEQLLAAPGESPVHDISFLHKLF